MTFGLTVTTVRLHTSMLLVMLLCTVTIAKRMRRGKEELPGFSANDAAKVDCCHVTVNLYLSGRIVMSH